MVEITEIEADPASAAGKTFASAAPQQQYSREPRDLRLQDKVFLSHSGADKEFVTRLYEDLRRRYYAPFLDKKSLPKATTVTMQNILQVARQCRLAVFVLSEDFFTRSKNPMLELAACVESKSILLPLFYKLTVEEFKNKERRQGWFKIWRQWEEEDSQTHLEDGLKVNISNWKRALKIIRDQNGVEFNRPENIDSEEMAQREEMYRKSIIDSIFQLVPPDILWDDSKTQGKERLCKVVDLMYSNFPVSDATPKTSARILGLYGMGGTGKTTLCTTLLNFYWPEFGMRVCHIEFESGAAPSNEKILQLIKKVLRVVTNALPADILDGVTDVAQGWRLLKKHIRDNKVFLAVDNVAVESSKVASFFLEGGFQNESKVLVIGRSLDVLQNVLKKCEGVSDIKMVPTLTEEEAVEVFVQTVNHPSELSQEERRVFRDCVYLCHFKSEEDGSDQVFHPLALVGLASALEEEDPEDWNRTVKDWQSKGMKALPKDRVFDLLQISYDRLTEDEKQTFMDIALFVPRNVVGGDDVLKWLGFLHGDEETKRNIRVLRKRSLLINCRFGSIRIHDLYREMARLVAEEAKGKSLFMEGQTWIGEELPKEVTRRIERLGLACCDSDKPSFVLNVSAYPQLRVLKLIRNKGLRRITIGRQNRSLKSLEVESEDEGLTVAVEGLKNCSLSLGWLYFQNCAVPKEYPTWLRWSSDIDAFGCQQALRWVEVRANDNNLRLLNLQASLQGCKHLVV